MNRPAAFASDRRRFIRTLAIHPALFTTQCHIKGEAQNERDGVLRDIRDKPLAPANPIPLTSRHTNGDKNYVTHQPSDS